MLLHETAMATAMDLGGLKVWVLVFSLPPPLPQHFHFLQSDILEGFVAGLLFQTGFCKVIPPFMKLL